MSNLVNEYERILNYFDSQKVINKPAIQQQKITKPQKPKEIPKQESIEPKRTKAEVLEETRKLIEESQIHGYIPAKSKPFIGKGFDIKHFETMMRARLIDEYKKLSSYERPYISVSELYTCLRQCYYTRKRYAVSLNDMFKFAYLYLIQEVGNEVHRVVQELYNFNETEKTIVSEKYKVKGRLDGIRESCIYEIKTYDEADNKVGKTYIQEHFFQGNIYANILNDEYAYEIDTVVLIYIPRSLKKIVTFNLDLDPSLAKSHLEKAKTLLSCLENTEIPDPIGAKMDHCKYCIYKKFCEKDGYKEIAQPFEIVDDNKIKNKKDEDDKKKPVFLL